MPSWEHTQQEVSVEEPGVFEMKGGRFRDRGGELEKKGSVIRDPDL
jgi:hypothetical protein